MEDGRRNKQEALVQTIAAARADHPELPNNYKSYLQELALEVPHLLERLDPEEVLAREIHLVDAAPLVELPIRVQDSNVV